VTTLTREERPEPFTVKIICTDKGQHKRYGLARAIWDPWVLEHGVTAEEGRMRLSHGGAGPWLPPNGWWLPDETAQDREVHRLARMQDPDDHTPVDAYVFWCPGCKRTPQIKHAKFWQMLEDFVRVGVPLLDISRLPF
jgi:hypothetical protein